MRAECQPKKGREKRFKVVLVLVETADCMQADIPDPVKIRTCHCLLTGTSLHSS